MPPKRFVERAKAVVTSVAMNIAGKFKKSESADVTNPDYRPLGQEDDSLDASEHDWDDFQDIDLDSPTGTIQRDPPVSREDDIYLDAAHQINGVLSFRDIEEEEKAAFKADIRSRVNVILRHNAALYQKQIAKMKQEMKNTVVETDASSVGYRLTNHILDREKALKSAEKSNAEQHQKIEQQRKNLQELRDTIVILQEQLDAYKKLGGVTEIATLKGTLEAKIEGLNKDLDYQTRSVEELTRLRAEESMCYHEFTRIQVEQTQQADQVVLEAAKEGAARELRAKNLVLTAMKEAFEEELSENQEDSRALIAAIEEEAADKLRKTQEASQAEIAALKQTAADELDKTQKESQAAIAALKQAAQDQAEKTAKFTAAKSGLIQKLEGYLSLRGTVGSRIERFFSKWFHLGSRNTRMKNAEELRDALNKCNNLGDEVFKKSVAPLLTTFKLKVDTSVEKKKGKSGEIVKSGEFEAIAKLVL